MVEEKLKIVKFKKMLFFMLVWNYILTMNLCVVEEVEPIEAMIITLMRFVPFIFYWDFKNIFRRNKHHLKENFSVKVLFQSIIEIIVFMIVLVYIFKVFRMGGNFLIGGVFLLINATLLVVTKFLEVTYKADDLRSKFFATVNNTGDINQNVTMFWRMKIWFTPKFNLKKLRKNNNDIYRLSENQVMWIGLGLFISFGSEEELGKIFETLIIIWLLFITFMDRIFRTYVRFQGVCVDSELVKVPRSERIAGYSYRVIDFHNQREINIFVNDEKYPRYKKWDKVEVIHGAFGKKIKDHYKV